MNWKQRSVALLCGCAAVPAFAQAAPADAPAGAPAAAPTASAPSADDIVVSGAKWRNERLRDVPISITALDQETLQKSGVTNTLDIARLYPGRSAHLGHGLEVQPSIRGISSSGAGVGNSTNVALYVDGIYQPNSASQLIDLPDVEQVEVLKGPQGTYYGQNAAGGAIIVHTVDPTFKLQGQVSASYGNYNDKVFRGYVTGPISWPIDQVGDRRRQGGDKDAFRYNIVFHKRGDGLEASRAIRGKILWKPTDNFASLLTAYYIHRHDHEVGEGINIKAGDAARLRLCRARGRIHSQNDQSERDLAQHTVVDRQSYLRHQPAGTSGRAGSASSARPRPTPT